MHIRFCYFHVKKYLLTNYNKILHSYAFIVYHRTYDFHIDVFLRIFYKNGKSFSKIDKCEDGLYAKTNYKK